MKKNFISKIISIILIIILIIGAISLPFIPRFYDLFKDSSVGSFKSHTFIYKVAFYSCYIICLFIVYELVRLFNVIYNGSPFRKEIEDYLKTMTIMFMILFLIVIIKSIFIPTLLSFVVAILCFLVSLSFYVLKDAIKAAIKYKAEVDFTV